MCSPSSVSELKQMIARQEIKLSKGMEGVLRLAFEDVSLVALGSTRSVAAACSVSPATVSRLASHLGFRRFRDLKRLFQEQLGEYHRRHSKF